MPRWLRVLLICAAIAVGMYGVFLVGTALRSSPPPDSVACTMEAKVCPDGSTVGRVGPNCEFAACPGADTSTTTAPSSVTVEAQINKSATALRVGILPLSVLEDSRCPVGVECRWAGTVKLKVRIHSALGDSDMTMTLGTPITTEGETITLRDVLPVPRAGVKITPAQYHFVFEVAKRAQ
jgi:hypothetical protein